MKKSTKKENKEKTNLLRKLINKIKKINGTQRGILLIYYLALTSIAFTIFLILKLNSLSNQYNSGILTLEKFKLIMEILNPFVNIYAIYSLSMALIMGFWINSFKKTVEETDL